MAEGPGAQGSAFVDGQVVPLRDARVPITDRGFLFADSVFETVRTYGGRPFLLGDHLDRLRRSASALELPLPWDDATLRDVVERVLGARGFVDEGAVRIMVTRGDGGAGLSFPESAAPRLVVLCRPAPRFAPESLSAGVALVRPSGPASKDAGVPGHVKSGAYLGNVLALRQAAARGGFEALLRGPDGSWGEASTSNLFAVLGGRLVTPGVEAGILPGVTRAIVLRLAQELGISVRVGSLFDAELEVAEELFITSTLKELLPATVLDGRSVGDGRPGAWTSRLRAAFAVLVRAVMEQGCDRLDDLVFNAAAPDRA